MDVTVTERLKASGSWRIRLKDTTPADLRRSLRLAKGDASKGWALCVVTPKRVDVADYSQNVPMLTTPHPLLGAARWAGWLLDTSNSARELAGEGLLALCEDSDGAGEYVFDLADKKVRATASTIIDRLINGGTLTDVLDGVGTVTFPGSNLRGGTIHTGGATLTTGDFLRSIAWLLKDLSYRAGGYAFRIRPTGHLDWGSYGQLWPNPPRCIVGRGLPDTDDARWVTVRTDATWEETVNGWADQALVDAPGMGPQTTVAPASSYVSPLTGQDLVRYRTDTDMEDDETVADWRSRALGQIVEHLDSIVTSTDLAGEITPQTALEPGEMIYLWDPEAGLIDTGNAETYAGELIHPRAARLQAVTWPVVDPMGVYILAAEFVPGIGLVHRITDLTDHVEYDTNTAATLEVGRQSPSL